jgi:hypothetical protein
MIELIVNGQAVNSTGTVMCPSCGIFAATGKRIRELPIKRTKLV